MITFEQAREIAIRKIGPDCGLVEEQTVEKPYGWYFWYQSKAWLRSRRMRDMLIGSGGFIVEREDGRVFEFGSAFPLERNFAAYEYGLKYKSYDLTFTRIYDLERTLDHVSKLRLYYVIPEFAHGRQWRIPREYDRLQLAEKLRVLPYTFSRCGGFFLLYEVFLALDRARCCEYELREHLDDRTD